MPRPPSSSSLHLDIPRNSTDLQDPGAHELRKYFHNRPCIGTHSLPDSSSDEYFSDASEGRRKSSRPQTPVSPIPKTRVERVDDEPAYGEVPGTPAYDKRVLDAVPDEIEVVPEGRLSKRSSQILERSTTPEGTPIPRTVVEKVDPDDTSYGDDPNTRAYQHRKSDSVPDIVLKAPRPGEQRRSHEEEGASSITSPTPPIPETIITPVDSGRPNNPFGSEGQPLPACTSEEPLT